MSCLVQCNMNMNCLMATLDMKLNNCTLFNNQITLIHTVNKTDIVLLSKKYLSVCIDDYYPDYVNSVCKLKKLNGIACSSSEECQERLGLECVNVQCQCSNFPNKLIFFLYIKS